MPPLSRLRSSLAVATLLVGLGTSASAAPDFATLPPAAAAASAAVALDRFLIDKGLMPAPSATPDATPAFADRVRNKASDMVATAMNFLGVPYRRGGNDAESGFDCSGFTRQVFETSLGLMLPRRADQQAKAPGLLAVKRGELQPGDLVFFNTLKRTFSHVGIYLGDGKFIHAPKPGGEVRVENMNFAYWTKRFTGGRRAQEAQDTQAPQTTIAADAAAMLKSGVDALVPTTAPATTH